MREQEVFSELSVAFADFLARLEGRKVPELELAARLLCEAVSGGHVCLDLGRAAGGDLTDAFGEAPPALEAPGLDDWTGALQATSVVGPPGTFRPLILDTKGRLYLYRYWRYENILSRFIMEREGDYFDPPAGDALSKSLLRHFPRSGGPEVDWQRTAAVLALARPFCVISGGPGTGKTSTVVKVLALMLELAGERSLEVALAAPTGKAAARLKEALTRARSGLSCSEAVRQQIPVEVQTLHRLLGSMPGSSGFRHHRGNPLPHDVVVVDEASMVDLPMLAKLVRALSPQARLLLIGDRHQLASVEAGAALGDICRGGEDLRYSPTLQRRWGGELNLPDSCYGTEVSPGLADSIVVLKRNFRFGEGSPIGNLARAVRDGEAAEALALLEGENVKEMRRLDVPPPNRLPEALEAVVVKGFSDLLEQDSVEEALRRCREFTVLCALRSGPYGADGINTLCRRILADRGLIRPQGHWYRGRPVLVTSNDYRLHLFNGDVGMVWPDTVTGEPRVYFSTPDGGVRSVAPGRLPSHQTAYALTVHKSQGSEFDRVLLVLPPARSPVLTRELLYTAVTRARRGVEVMASREHFLWAVARRRERTSGLRDALWGTGK